MDYKSPAFKFQSLKSVNADCFFKTAPSKSKKACEAIIDLLSHEIHSK